jgi:hypothetical protein
MIAIYHAVVINDVDPLIEIFLAVHKPTAFSCGMRTN